MHSASLVHSRWYFMMLSCIRYQSQFIWFAYHTTMTLHERYGVSNHWKLVFLCNNLLRLKAKELGRSYGFSEERSIGCRWIFLQKSINAKRIFSCHARRLKCGYRRSIILSCQHTIVHIICAFQLTEIMKYKFIHIHSCIVSLTNFTEMQHFFSKTSSYWQVKYLPTQLLQIICVTCRESYSGWFSFHILILISNIVYSVFHNACGCIRIDHVNSSMFIRVIHLPIMFL